MAGLNEGAVRTGPQTVHLDITNGCNTNCVTCWDHSPQLSTARPRSWKRQRVDPAEVEALLDDILTLGGLEAIILSGMGEPFTHPDARRLVRAVKARKLHLTVITNLVAARPDAILEDGIDQLLIGIHAASEGSYRAFHPSFRRDEWPRLLSMLEQFRAAGRRYKHVQVICRTNAHELVEMVRLAHRFDAAQVNFKLAGLKDGTEAVCIQDAQRAALRDKWIGEALEEARRLGVDTNLGVFARQLEAGGAATAPIREIGCFIGHYYARVLVDGTVLYCCNTEVRVGSLSDRRFSELWDGAEWNALRERLRRGEYFDSCNQCGKLNQNVKIAEKFAQRFGRDRLFAISGRGGPPARSEDIR